MGGDVGLALGLGLPVEIEAVLHRHKARSGYAVLEGVTRAVWALPQVEIKLDKGSLSFSHPRLPFPRGLVHVGDRAFYPMGASAVRIKFATAGGATTLTVQDGEILVTATKRA